jgi:hypothetical protein
LELTRERLLPALEGHQQQLARMPPWQPPTLEAQDNAFLRKAYLNRGFNRDNRPEEFGASHQAVERTRAETGVTAATTSLVLGQDASGQFTCDSPIRNVRFDADGEIRIAATTTPEDIARASTDVRGRGRSEDTPQQSSPERTIRRRRRRNVRRYRFGISLTRLAAFLMLLAIALPDDDRSWMFAGFSFLMVAVAAQQIDRTKDS